MYINTKKQHNSSIKWFLILVEYWNASCVCFSRRCLDHYYFSL